MKTRLLLALLVLSSVAAFALPSLQDADACGLASRRGRKVAIANESAIIIWDEQAKTEHFIRRASFVSDADDFGFVVPTPTQPELAEASDDSFKHLEMLFAKTPTKGKGGGKGGGKGAPAEAPKVEVLDEKRVANQHVVVLKANDVDALGKWLTDHDYEFSADLKDRVKPYIDAKSDHHHIQDRQRPRRHGCEKRGVHGSAMSFKTEMPFYPYRESAQQRDKNNVSPIGYCVCCSSARLATRERLASVARPRARQRQPSASALFPAMACSVCSNCRSIESADLANVMVFEDRFFAAAEWR